MVQVQGGFHHMGEACGAGGLEQGFGIAGLVAAPQGGELGAGLHDQALGTLKLMHQVAGAALANVLFGGNGVVAQLHAGKGGVAHHLDMLGGDHAADEPHAGYAAAFH